MDEQLKKLKALLESLADIPEDSNGEHRSEILSHHETDELEALRKAAAAELRAIDDPTRLDEAKSLRDAVDVIGKEVTARQEKAKEAAAELAKLTEGLPEDEAETEEEDESEEVETPEAETETEEAPKVEEKVPSLAAAISTLDRKIEEQSKPKTELDVRAVTAGAAAGRTFGDHEGMDAVGDVFHRYATQVSSGKQSLVHIEFDYPEDRQLDQDARENTQRINQALKPQALVAAGGICDPVPADFSHPICSDRGRPIRAGLPTFQLNRGGVRFAPAATIGDLADAITVWTEETDSDPGTAVKACPVVDCPEEVEVKVDAIVRCLTIGNFQARFNPELWASRLELLLVEHDQAAEQNSYNQIINGSTAVTAQDYTGTIQNVLVALDTAAAGIRSRHRISQGTAVRAILPDWIEAALRSHLAQQNPGGRPEQYAAAMDNWYAARNIRPIFSPDVDIFGAQGAGALETFPTDITVPVFPEGTWVFGDGGSLDLGTQITDSTLNEVNNRQAFAETFEVTFFRGCESLAVEIPLGDGCICLTESTA
jgi:hypothetical protein